MNKFREARLIQAQCSVFDEASKAPKQRAAFKASVLAIKHFEAGDVKGALVLADLANHYSKNWKPFCEFMKKENEK